MVALPEDVIRAASRTVHVTADCNFDFAKKLEGQLQAFGDIEIIEATFNSMVGTYYDLRDAVQFYRECKDSLLDDTKLKVNYVYVDTVVGRAREDELIAVRLAPGCPASSFVNLISKVGTISGLAAVGESTLILRFYDLGAAKKARMSLAGACGESGGLKEAVEADLVPRSFTGRRADCGFVR
jgi:hypothetical protein